jgi:hypothetical protein
MKIRFIGAALILFLLGAHASGHRLDEYLQATIISIEKDRVQLSMRLIPGVAVFSSVLASIDTNGDGVISEAEQRAYAQRLLADLSLTIDGHPLQPKLVSVDFPQVAQLQEGLGEIQIQFTADIPPGGPNRKLSFENHHQRRFAAYLVNCLVPSDPDIRIVAQHRDELQSHYELDYVQARGSSTPAIAAWWPGTRRWINAIGFTSLFHLGMRHIAEGTDHLLFLLALLLPAPLFALGTRWGGSAGVRDALQRILKVVTAFTVGHSLTLALAALGVVRVPSRPIEILIAVSIFVSAVHALRPLFPGREAGIAAFFGLIHGLAFAATLGQLGLARWDRVVGILAFNLGIEAMQLIVVAAVMPSLLLLSRSRAYSVFRILGAVFAGGASLSWIAERLLHWHTSVDAIVNGIAHYAVWIAAALFLVGLLCWSLPKAVKKEADASDALSPSALKGI